MKKEWSYFKLKKIFIGEIIFLIIISVIACKPYFTENSYTDNLKTETLQVNTENSSELDAEALRIQEEARKSISEAANKLVYEEKHSMTPLTFEEMYEKYFGQSNENTNNQIEYLVWLSGTGIKYHTINNCGNMNPSYAHQININDAINQGYEPCSNCN